MLQVGSQAHIGKECPQGILHHAVGLPGPCGEVGGIQGELFLQLFHDIRIVIIEDGAVSGGKGIDFLFRIGKCFGRYDRPESVFGYLPYFVMSTAVGNDNAAGLHIESRRDFPDDRFDAGRDFFLGQGDILSQCIIRTTFGEHLLYCFFHGITSS